MSEKYSQDPDVTMDDNTNTTKEKKQKKVKLTDKEKNILLKQELDFLKKQRVVDLANLDNQRKQYEIQYIEKQKYAITSFVRDLLPGLDMFSMAVNVKDVSPEIKNWLKGFEMIEQMFFTELSNVGVNEIKTNVGDEFNSKYHNAVETIKATDMKDDTIAKVLNKGYAINSRLLRPVNVVVVRNKKVKDIKEDIKGE